MIKQAVCLLLLTGCAVAYPKVTMLFREPDSYLGEVQCCHGIFNTPHYYNDVYQVTALYLSSHIRNSSSLEIGPEPQNIRVTMSEQPPGGEWKVVASYNYTEVAEPLQLLRIPMSYTTNTASWFIFEIWYGGALTYPQYSPFNIPVAPYNTTFNYYILGMDYEYLGVPV
ncbi:uncharacterized protein LOC126456337 [Schistocerca serialis cubense]|uniref:uncharacterized protein LOC126456337 n=1 Tax=Schistocerca serialis cubense TaxID=2023355 RepID=UPI00214EE31F|nr:uncharacterized protein LOC126456337 [Schistocerca serialis cubense]